MNLRNRGVIYSSSPFIVRGETLKSSATSIIVKRSVKLSIDIFCYSASIKIPPITVSIIPIAPAVVRLGFLLTTKPKLIKPYKIIVQLLDEICQVNRRYVINV